MNTQITLTSELICAAYRRALKTGLWFRLRPEEKAILFLSRFIKKIKSLTLKELLLKIITKVWPSLAFKIKALEIGFKLLEKRVEVAIKLGYKKAESWLNNIDFAFYLGVSWLNTSPVLRPPLN